jgi:hypothetical protein
VIEESSNDLLDSKLNRSSIRINEFPCRESRAQNVSRHPDMIILGQLSGLKTRVGLIPEALVHTSGIQKIVKARAPSLLPHRLGERIRQMMCHGRPRSSTLRQPRGLAPGPSEPQPEHIHVWHVYRLEP